MGRDDRIILRCGSDDDLEVLAELSYMRNQEQRYHEDTSIELLRERMRVQIRLDHLAFLFEVQGKVVGYSLVSRSSDPLSILEYFLIKEARGKGYGYEAVTKLIDATGSTSIDVSANAWREAAGAM